MDRIKKLKVKKQDGTFSDYIPIGADAENIDTTDGESVQLKLNKKPYYYDNVADMKADTKLKAGDMAVTLGYYNVNDGGGAEYNIVNGNYTDDGGSYHELNNQLFAELIVKDSIFPEQFGYNSDLGFTINKILTAGLKTIRLNNKQYICNTTINLVDKVGITIYGNNQQTSKIIAQTGNTPVINMIGSVNTKLLDFTIRSTPGYAQTNPSTLGIVIGRTETHLSSQNHIFKNLRIVLFDGNLTINNNYGSIGLYNFAGESFIIDNCWIQSDLPIYLTNNDDLGIGILYGAYNYPNKTTTDISITNDCYILAKNNLSIKMDNCNSINITNCYFQNSNYGNVFEVNGVSGSGYEFNNLFIDNIRIEGNAQNLIHVLEDTKLRNFHITGGSNTITDNEIYIEPRARLIKGFFNFQSIAQYCAKRNGDSSTYAFIEYSIFYTTKKMDIYAFDNSLLIGTPYDNRKDINSFKSIGIGSSGEVVFTLKKSIIFSYAIPTDTTNHSSGDICFCSNASSDILLWQYNGSTQTWVPVYKNLNSSI